MLFVSEAEAAAALLTGSSCFSSSLPDSNDNENAFFSSSCGRRPHVWLEQTSSSNHSCCSRTWKLQQPEQPRLTQTRNKEGVRKREVRRDPGGIPVAG